MFKSKKKIKKRRKYRKLSFDAKINQKLKNTVSVGKKTTYQQLNEEEKKSRQQISDV